jgi:cytochrome P450
MMPKFRPPFPEPLKSRSSLLKRFIKGGKSWLDIQSERGYTMKMGHFRMPGLNAYMVNEPGLVRRILVEQAERFPKHKLTGRILKPLLGDSIFTSNAELWKRQRRLIDPAFEQARLKVVFPLMRAAIDDLLNRLDSREDGSVIDVDIEMTHVTADVIFRTVFSQPLEGEDANNVFDTFTKLQEASTRMMMLLSYQLPEWLSPWRSKWNRSCKDVRNLLEKYIRPRFDAHRRGEITSYQDILASLIEAQDPETGARFGFDELVDQIAIIFIAGHETSASALTWASYLIAMSPDIQDRLHDEVCTIINDREPEYSDIKKLRLTWNVFRETLRLYPPIGFIVREAMETQCMRDKNMPAGSVVLVSPWLIQRHRVYWKQPDIFDPDRYEKPETKESLRCAYLPFGLGPRVCMGAAFAMQEAVMVLASLARRYHLEPLPDHTPKPIGRVTIRSENGVRLRFNRRRME